MPMKKSPRPPRKVAKSSMCPSLPLVQVAPALKRHLRPQVRQLRRQFGVLGPTGPFRNANRRRRSRNSAPSARRPCHPRQRDDRLPSARRSILAPLHAWTASPDISHKGGASGICLSDNAFTTKSYRSTEEVPDADTVYPKAV